ncbi:MAG: GAF domain-containing protein [Coriobacteriales bacterium]|nr:GAF domain-containing protein [Coriobacteriales bacterium]
MPTANTGEPQDYATLIAQLEALCEGETHWLPVLSNAAALLGETLDTINWAGFYLAGSYLSPKLPADELVLGPFWGKIACMHIPFGKGVCGTAVAADKSQRVEDVHAFAGHIACDAASRSELVVPLHAQGQVVGVLDIDSPALARFTPADQAGLEQFARVLEAYL